MSATIRIAFLVLCALAAVFTADGQLAPAQVGLMLDGSGGLRPVYGIAASSTIGDPVVAGVVAAGCSAQICLAKTQDRLWSWPVGSENAVSVPAPPGMALFAFTGASAFVYLPTAATLNQWSNGSLTALAFSPVGEVLALRAAGDGVDYAVRRDQATFIEHLSIATGSVSVQAALGVTGPVALLTNATVITANGLTTLVRSDGSIVNLPMTNVQSLAWMGGSFLQATTAGASWVIRVDSGHEQAFLLPGASAAVEHLQRKPVLPHLTVHGPIGIAGGAAR